MKNTKESGFSLIEVLVVVGIMATLLVLGSSLFRQAGQSESREAVRSLILSGLNNAQSSALSSGEPVAIVMTPYEQGLEEQLGRSFAIFEVRQDDVTGDFEAGRQLRRWTSLPGRFIFSKGSTVSDSGQNAFGQSSVVSIPVVVEQSSRRSVDMPAIIFGGTGNVLWPSGDGELELHLVEGAVSGGSAFVTNDNNDDWRKREVFVIGRQTGRARFLQTR